MQRLTFSSHRSLRPHRPHCHEGKGLGKFEVLSLFFTFPEARGVQVPAAVGP
jgi:hypothetical protein